MKTIYGEKKIGNDDRALSFIFFGHWLGIIYLIPTITLGWSKMDYTDEINKQLALSEKYKWMKHFGIELQWLMLKAGIDFTFRKKR